MAAFTDKLAKAAGGSLRGEPVLAGCRVTPKGGIRRTALSMGIGGLVGAAIANSGRTEAVDGFPNLRNMSIGLTPTRLMVFSNGAMTGSPKRVVGEVPVASIAAVDGGATRVIGMKTGTVTLTLAGGTEVGLEIPKISMKDGEQLVALLRAQIEARR